MATSIVPIIMLRDCMLVILHRWLTDTETHEMETQILTMAQHGKARVVIADLSLVPVVDSFMCRRLFDVGLALKLLGSRMIICGLPNAVAMAMVELGIMLRHVQAMRNIDTALDSLERL